MGTMDVITLDDTIDNDASLYIIDEEPIFEQSSSTVMKEMTNKQMKRKKKKSENKKKLAKKKKMNSEMQNTSNWLVMGSQAQSNHNIIAQMTSLTNSSSTSGKESQTSSQLGGDSVSSSLQNKRNNNDETIIIPSDEEDNVEVIELSDEEVGTIGGELSKTVHRAQKQLSSFQRRGGNITAAWPNSKPKNRLSPFKKSCSTNNKESACRTLRPIVIDGSNVAFGHGSRSAFSSRGLQICCDYFLKRGHTVKVFVPQFRRRHHATSDFHILDKLEKDKILVFTPSRKVDGKNIISYDDRYIVEYATKCGGVIVSRDNYQDLLAENNEWKETINKRLLMFTWVDDMIMFPQDPLGRNGPSLDEFLSFPPETNTKGNT